MSSIDRPDSVLEAKNKFAGHNCVACVAAVLYNEASSKPGLATANVVAARWNIAPHVNLLPDRAVKIISEFTGLHPTPGRINPWDANAPAGHYAVFCLGRRHVIYGHRGPGPHFYLYDPQTEKDQQLGTLMRGGYAPFESYHFAE